MSTPPKLTPEQITLMAYSQCPEDWDSLENKELWIDGFECGVRASYGDLREQWNQYLFKRDNKFENALRKILCAVQAYLPPGGITKDELISRVISCVDPWPTRPAPAQQELDDLQDIAAFIGVGGYNGATQEQLVQRIKDEFARLSAPAQQPEPCKQLCELCVKRGYLFCANAAETTPLPAQQREWAGLTDEDIRPMCGQEWVFDTIKQWAEIISAKLKEKNGG